MGTVLKEAALHSEATFDKYCKILKPLAEKYDIPIVNGHMTYNDFVVKWAKESGKRHPEYRAKNKPFLQKLACDGMIPEQDQESIFGYVVKTNEDRKGGYVGHTSVIDHVAEANDLHITIVCCKGSTCCRLRRDEEEVENVPVSSESDSSMKANISDNAEIYEIQDHPERSRRAPSLSLSCPSWLCCLGKRQPQQTRDDLSSTSQ